MLERVKCGWEVFQLINTWWSDRSQVSQAGERWLAPLSRELHLRLIPNNLPKDKFKFKTYLETGSSRCAGHALQRRRPHFTICHLALFPAPWAIICNPSPWGSITRSKNQSSSTKTSTCDSPGIPGVESLGPGLFLIFLLGFLSIPHRHLNFILLHSRVISQINESYFERLNAFCRLKMYFPFTQYKRSQVCF